LDPVHPSAPVIARFIDRLAANCLTIRSIWIIGDRASLAMDDVPAEAPWELFAFADTRTLLRLRAQTAFHQSGVYLCVVTDGDLFQRAWGGARTTGSLVRWNWMQAGSEAFYSEPRWAGPAPGGAVERTRRKAVCLWRRSNESSHEHG